MALPSLEFLSRIGQLVIRAIPFVGSVMGFVAWIYDLGERVLAGGLNWILTQVSAIDTSVFSNAAFGTVAGIGYANAVFPLSEFVTIWAAVFTAAGAIVLIRWVKSFIPAIAN